MSIAAVSSIHSQLLINELKRMDADTRPIMTAERAKKNTVDNLNDIYPLYCQHKLDLRYSAVAEGFRCDNCWPREIYKPAYVETLEKQLVETNDKFLAIKNELTLVKAGLV